MSVGLLLDPSSPFECPSWDRGSTRRSLKNPFNFLRLETLHALHIQNPPFPKYFSKCLVNLGYLSGYRNNPAILHFGGPWVCENFGDQWKAPGNSSWQKWIYHSWFCLIEKSKTYYPKWWWKIVMNGTRNKFFLSNTDSRFRLTLRKQLHPLMSASSPSYSLSFVDSSNIDFSLVPVVHVIQHRIQRKNRMSSIPKTPYRNESNSHGRT